MGCMKKGQFTPLSLANEKGGRGKGSGGDF